MSVYVVRDLLCGLTSLSVSTRGKETEDRAGDPQLNKSGIASVTNMSSGNTSARRDNTDCPSGEERATVASITLHREGLRKQSAVKHVWVSSDVIVMTSSFRHIVTR